jgi:streptomycin 6-kinase
VAASGAFDPRLPVFRSLGGTADGRAWLSALPGIVAELEARWKVETGAPYREGTASWVAPATIADGTAAVLKVGWPHREARGEADALRLWAGRGTPRLYAADRSLYALLIERCEPGLPLALAPLRPEDGLLAAARALRGVWVAPPADHRFERLDEVGPEWSVTVRGRMASLRPPFDPGLVALGAELLETLPRSAAATVVVHGDANPTNFLSARREPWLLIDAKPMVGDPAYDLAPLALQLGSPLEGTRPEAVLRGRFALLGDALGLSVDRMLAWSLARTVESALWYASGGETATGSEEMATAAILAGLI